MLGSLGYPEPTEKPNCLEISLIQSSLFSFAKKVSHSIQKVVSCNRIGISVIGLEVPHAHIHLVPINKLDDMNFKRKKNISEMELLDLAERIRKNIK